MAGGRGVRFREAPFRGADFVVLSRGFQSHGGFGHRLAQVGDLAPTESNYLTTLTCRGITFFVS